MNDTDPASRPIDVCNPLPNGCDGQLRRRGRAPSRFLFDRRGETAIEYGLIACLIVVAIIASLGQFSNATNKMYNKIVNSMSAAP